MVCFEDLDTPLEVSLEGYVSWDDSDEHAAALSGVVRNFEVVETVGPAIVVTYERKVTAARHRARSHVTSFPPFARFVGDLEGECAGSRFVVAHRPEGRRIRIDVYGDVQSKTMRGEPLRMHWLEVLTKTHEVDRLALSNFRDRLDPPSR